MQERIRDDMNAFLGKIDIYSCLVDLCLTDE